MPQVSRNKLSRRAEEELVQNLNLVLSSINKREEMLLFFNALVTDIEKIMLAKRLAMVILIAEGMNDTEISERLHVTRMTVAKFRYYYESRAMAGFQIAFNKLEADKQLGEFKKFLISLARYSAKAAGGRI